MSKKPGPQKLMMPKAMAAAVDVVKYNCRQIGQL